MSVPVKKVAQIPLAFEGRSAYGRADFLIGASNRDAIGWIDRWPEWSAPMLVISGPAASGKTHLCAVWQERSEAALISADMLTQISAEEIAAKSQHLVLDGIDPWLGANDAETTLFHLYNLMKEEGRTFLVTMRMAPSHVDFTLPDLASRFRAAPVAQIQTPDDMLLGSVLIKLFSDRQLQVAHEVIKYVLPRMERSFAAARDIVARADRLSLAGKRGISVPLMRDVLIEMQNEL